MKTYETDVWSDKELLKVKKQIEENGNIIHATPTITLHQKFRDGTDKVTKWGYTIIYRRKQ